MGTQINRNEAGEISVCQFDSPLGFITAKANQMGLLVASFNELEFERINSVIPPNIDKTNTSNFENPYLKELQIQLNEYFDGKRKSFDLTIFPNGTAFQQKVWNELLSIPYGETRSYQQQTNKMGDPKAIRAVASANGKNPLAIIIPCHRIIGANGNLTGYAGGLWRKKWLLDHETKYSGRSYQSKLGL